jgi:hypothetical protein
MPSDAWNEAYDAWVTAKADAAKYTSKMWAELIGSKARANYETLANEAKARRDAAKRRLTKIEADERKAAAETTRATKAAERAAAADARREDQEDRIGQRQGGRTDRTTVRQQGRTDRTTVRQQGQTDRTTQRQQPENVAARSASTAAWAEPTGEAVTTLAAAAAAIYGGQTGEGGSLLDGLGLDGLAEEHGNATGKAAADELLSKAIPYAIGAVLIVGLAVYLGSKK